MHISQENILPWTFSFMFKTIAKHFRIGIQCRMCAQFRFNHSVTHRCIYLSFIPNVRNLCHSLSLSFSPSILLSSCVLMALCKKPVQWCMSRDFIHLRNAQPSAHITCTFSEASKIVYKNIVSAKIEIYRVCVWVCVYAWAYS